MVSARVSYWQIFRLIFVIFSLYLMGDAFYRWDGFRYHSTFPEFLPGVALVTILWSITAVFTAALIWLPVKILERFFPQINWKTKIEYLLLFLCIFALLAAAGWSGKRFIWKWTPATIQLKIIFFSTVTCVTIFLTWLFRKKMSVIQERITPLVWLFGILAVLSIPVAGYYAWGKQTGDVISQKIPQTSKPGENRPNIILVTFDALTARDMSVYGYHRPTTPFISEWSKKASLFTRAKAQSHITTPTTASLMTGKRLWTHQTYHIGGSSKPVKGSAENLPLLLRNNGYYTMAFIATPFASVKTLGIANSFDIAPAVTEFRSPRSLYGIIDKLLTRLFENKIKLYDWFTKSDFIIYRLLHIIDFSTTEFPPEKAFNKFLTVIDNHPSEPFFVWIHLFPPHQPYLPPGPYMGMFDSSSALRTSKSQMKKERQRLKNQQRHTQEIQPIVEVMRARYDEFIRYCDKEFEDFITQLTTRNKLKNTLIILSSDHGESFEHNCIGHVCNELYEQLTNIPLIIKEPNQSEGQVINDVIEQIDIAPTILSLAKISVPSWMEGRSLAPLLKGEILSLARIPAPSWMEGHPPAPFISVESPSSMPAFSMALQKNHSRGRSINKGTIAVWKGDYKLIHYLEERKSLLFNLKQDPDELNNLFDKEPESGHYLLALIQENLRKANEKIRGEQ